MTAERQDTRRYLGVGWKFPLQVTPTGGIATARYEQRVEEAVYLVLATARGERVMLPEFGCGIHDLTFSPNNAGTVAAVLELVRDALVSNEPRIDLDQVAVDADPDQPNLMLIRVSYRIRANNAIGNVVYPFYLKEAS